MILSAEGQLQAGPQWLGGSAANSVAWCIARAALVETQTVDRIWASFHRCPSHLLRLSQHMQLVEEHLAFFFSMAEGFVIQTLVRPNELLLEDIAYLACVHALADPAIPRRYRSHGDFSSRRRSRYEASIMKRRMELRHVHPYATTALLAELSAEKIMQWVGPCPDETHLYDVVFEKLKWAGENLTGAIGMDRLSATIVK